MSTATTRDPLVVETRDGACWERRAVTSDGHGLYAAAGSCKCPEFLLVPLAELAEHGIVGTADALPVQEDDDRAKAPWGRGEDGRPLLPMGAHWTDVPELLDRRLAAVQARVNEAQSGNWYVAPATELGLAQGTVRTRVGGYPRTVGQFTTVLSADLELVLHAHADLSWCLEMIAKFRARVAELEADLYTEQAQHRTTLEQRNAHAQELLALRGGRAAPYAPTPEAHAQMREGLTRYFAGQEPALEGEHYAAVHHSYRVGRDLPETGGAK